MAKFCKKPIFIVLLALCLVACLALVACNNDPSGDTVTYTVTVNTGDDAPAAGVQVTVKQGGVSFEPKTTNDEGKVSFELSPNTYTVALSSLPEHYSVPEDANLTLTAENHDLTVTLARNFAYVVKLVNPDGSAFELEGVEVGVCTQTNCLEPVALGDGGVSYIEQAKGDYHVKIYNLPETYAYEWDKDFYYTGETFSATKTEMTITIYPVTVFDISGAPMTDAEKAAFAEANNQIGYDATAQADTAYKFAAEISANDTLFFSFTAPVTGKYYLYKGVFVTNLGELFVTENPSGGVYGSNYVNLEAGKTYYFRADNTDTKNSLNIEIAMTIPDTSYIQVTGVGATREVTVGDSNKYAIIQLTPTTGGYYQIESKGEVATFIACGTSETSLKNAIGNLSDATFEAGNSAAIKFTPDQLGASIYFGIAIQADDYAADVEVTITRLNEIKNTTNVIEVTETLEKAEKPENQTLVSAANSTITKDTTSGYYRTEDGKIVYVVLTKSISALLDNSSIAYSDIPNAQVATLILNVTSEEDFASTTKGNTYSDYKLFVRGFSDYEQTITMNGYNYSKPETLEEDNCYANYVNEDGAYPLNDELLAFLKAYYKQNSNSISADNWQFACYYYTDTVEVDDDDVIIGEYELVSFTTIIDQETETIKVGDIYQDRELTSDFYTLTVTSDTFVIYENGYDVGYSGYWTKLSSNSYKFTFTYEEFDMNIRDYVTVEIDSVTVEYGDTITVLVSEDVTWNEDITIVFQKASN